MNPINRCKYYQQALLLLAHGQLEAGEHDAVRRHLRGCSACSRRLTELSGVSLLLSDALLAAAAPPPVKIMPRPSFFPARENWLLSTLLGVFAMLAVLGAWKSAESSVLAASPPPLPSYFQSSDDCSFAAPSAIIPSSQFASGMIPHEQVCPSRRAVRPSILASAK